VHRALCAYVYSKAYITQRKCIQSKCVVYFVLKSTKFVKVYANFLKRINKVVVREESINYQLLTRIATVIFCDFSLHLLSMLSLKNKKVQRNIIISIGTLKNKMATVVLNVRVLL